LNNLGWFNPGRNFRANRKDIACSPASFNARRTANLLQCLSILLNITQSNAAIAVLRAIATK
jgi:hypothetical protein